MRVWWESLTCKWLIRGCYRNLIPWNLVAQVNDSTHPYWYYDDRPEPDDEDFDSDSCMPIPFADVTPSPAVQVYQRPPLAMDGRGKIPVAKSGKRREASYCGAQPFKTQRAAAAMAPETKPSQPRKIRKISQCVPRDPVVSGSTM